MIAGTEKPVTPDEAEDFSRAIDDANFREPGERKKLVAKLLEINAFARKHLGTVGRAEGGMAGTNCTGPVFAMERIAMG